MALRWDRPENNKVSLFRLTTFYLNRTDHVTEEVELWYNKHETEVSLANLHPCSQVRFGLQAVCQAGMEFYYSRMILHDGNFGKSNMSQSLQDQAMDTKTAGLLLDTCLYTCHPGFRNYGTPTTSLKGLDSLHRSLARNLRVPHS